MKTSSKNNLMEKIVSLCKRRGFIFPGSEIYGGLANSWDYGPLGVELKNNIKNLWWKRFVHERDDMVGIDAALIMNPNVWKASGHLETFNDPLVECKKCNARFRADKINLEEPCLNCGAKKSFTEAKQFNLMIKTFLGPVESEENVVYFRPETAQAIFVNFKNILDTTRKKLPFGVAQIGKAFRNEITPGNFVFRTREFDQMEIEYFIPEPTSEKEWQSHFEYWQNQMREWVKEIGINPTHTYEHEIAKNDLAHYSKRTIDFEYDYPFGRDELYGLAYRTDFDLKNHFKEPPYRDEKMETTVWPHVIEPSWGVDRSVLAVLCDTYTEENDRVILKLPAKLAPFKAAVFPLLANKPDLVKKAQEVYKHLKENYKLHATSYPISWDDRGNIGKRYYSQDEIGTPFCITIDFDTLENNTVTVRNRDTASQERVEIPKLQEYIQKNIS